mmetsp:Transcript_19709/g.50031  ORF Transcript_19709/g.50031 Transcript_19709/m.50031 type:complete len:633 (-) Transcript_19709:72-1970(-)
MASPSGEPIVTRERRSTAITSQDIPNFLPVPLLSLNSANLEAEKAERKASVSSEGVRRDSVVSDGEKPKVEIPQDCVFVSGRAILFGKDEAGNEEVRAGTIEALTEHLASEKSIDREFVVDFFIAFRYFLAPSELLAHLQKRYLYELPTDATEEQISNHKKFEGPIRLRVINVLKHWLSKHFYDFCENSQLFESMLNFINTTIAETNPKWISQLITPITTGNLVPIKQAIAASGGTLEFIAKTMQRPEVGLLKTHVEQKKKYKRTFTGAEGVDWWMEWVDKKSRQEAIAFGNDMIRAGLVQSATMPSRILSIFDSAESLYSFVKDEWADKFPKRLVDKQIKNYPIPEELPVYSFNPLELARQLTIKESFMFRAVTAMEVKSQAWMKRPEIAKNVVAIVNNFNALSAAVAAEIVCPTEPKDRKKALKHLIQLAEALTELKNYQSLVAVVSGLSSSSVSRLKETWKSLNKKSMQAWEKLSEEISPASNFSNYRNTIKFCEPPAIPYIAIFLKDLTFIEDGNPDYLAQNLINFEKMRMISKVFQDIQRFQEVQYCLKEVPVIQKWLDLKLTNTLDEKELYNISVKCEPGSRGSPLPGTRPNNLQKSSSARMLLFQSRKRSNTCPAPPPGMEPPPS